MNDKRCGTSKHIHLEEDADVLLKMKWAKTLLGEEEG